MLSQYLAEDAKRKGKSDADHYAKLSEPTPMCDMCAKQSEWTSTSDCCAVCETKFCEDHLKVMDVFSGS